MRIKYSPEHGINVLIIRMTTKKSDVYRDPSANVVRTIRDKFAAKSIGTTITSLSRLGHMR